MNWLESLFNLVAVSVICFTFYKIMRHQSQESEKHMDRLMARSLAELRQNEKIDEPLTSHSMSDFEEWRAQMEKKGLLSLDELTEKKAAAPEEIYE